jgi:REP element-mobilizing transposase RayT
MAQKAVDAASSRVDLDQKDVDAASSRVNHDRTYTQHDLAPDITRQDAASTNPVSTLFQYFDPQEPITNLCGNLPHWRQECVTYFVTFRTADSLPQDILRQWIDERDAWLKANPEPHSPRQKREYAQRFTARFHYWLDQGYGSCVLKRPDLRTLVENALRHFNGKRYLLDELVVMPNHVHVIVTPLPDCELSEILHSWKSFTANKINRLIKSSGSFWQKESFDHIVRSPDALENFRLYIRANPVDAASSRVTRRPGP